MYGNPWKLLKKSPGVGIAAVRRKFILPLLQAPELLLVFILPSAARWSPMSAQNSFQQPPFFSVPPKNGGLDHRPECQLMDGEVAGVNHPPVNASPYSRRRSCGHFMDINFKNPPPSFDMCKAQVRGSSIARVMVHSFTPATGFLHSNSPMLIRCVRRASGRSEPKFTHHVPQHNELDASITFPLGNTIAFT